MSAEEESMGLIEQGRGSGKDRETDELSMVSGAYDEGETDDAGEYQSDRSGDRAGRCEGPSWQQESGYRRTW